MSLFSSMIRGAARARSARGALTPSLSRRERAARRSAPVRGPSSASATSILHSILLSAGEGAAAERAREGRPDSQRGAGVPQRLVPDLLGMLGEDQALFRR